MTYDLTGKVKLIQEPQTFASGFSKREVVVTVEDGRFSQDINLEFLKEKISLLDNVSEGQELKVFFDIRGREHNGKYFNNLVGWKIENDDAVPATPPDREPDRPVIPPEPEGGGKPRPGDSVEWDDDDPPF